MTKKQYFLMRIGEIPEHLIIPYVWDKYPGGRCCVLTHLGCKLVRRKVRGLMDSSASQPHVLELQWSKEGQDLVTLFRDHYRPPFGQPVIITSQGDSGYVTVVNDYIMGPHLHPFPGSTPKQRLMYALNQLP